MVQLLWIMLQKFLKNMNIESAGLSNPSPSHIIYNIWPLFIYSIYEEAKEDGKETFPWLYLWQQDSH